MPGAAALPKAIAKPNNYNKEETTRNRAVTAKKNYQSPEKTRQKEYQLLEEKRDLYVNEVERIKREFSRL